MPPTDKQWREQVERDLYSLAFGLLDHQGDKQWLRAILQRYAPDRQETRPASLPEKRSEVAA